MASAYTAAQIQAFLQHIQIPPKYHPANQPPLDIAFLTALHVHTISTIPYENLSLHYSNARKISINPQDSFKKLVTSGHGRGGYCMEISILFNHVLRGLGFNAYTTGVRIRRREDGVPTGEFIGWVHIVNLVTLPSGERYMVDVGFGGDGATKPIPLIPGHVVNNLGQQEIRLIRDHIPQQTHRTEETKLWVYQYRNGKEKDWNSFYAFPDVEFLEPDFEIMNWFTGSNPESPQVYTMLVVKFLRRKREGGGGDEEEEIYGKRMLVNGTVKENLGGKTQVVLECKGEYERLRVLQEWFGVTLAEEDMMAISGHCTELR